MGFGQFPFFFDPPPLAGEFWFLMQSISRRPSWIESVLAIMLVGLAFWTLLSHAVGILFSGNFSDLTHWSWVVVLCVPLVYRLIYSRDGPDEPVLFSPGVQEPCDWHQFAIAVGLVAVYELGDIYFPNSRLHLFWGLAMLFLGRAWLVSRVREVKFQVLPGLTRTDTILVGLAIVGVVVVTLIAHRPDPDDQYYSNLAVMTLDYPDRPLLSWNGMIWGGDRVAWLPVDRFPSYELLVALVASWFAVEPMVISHLVFAPLFAAMTVLAQGLLLRHLVPDYWLSALMVCLFLLLAVGGETRAGYAVFAFVQLHFGKSVLFSVILPLLVLFGLRFMQTGRRRDWLLLFIGNIAALGCSTSALFLAPVATGLGLVASWRADWFGSRRLFVGLIGSAYPVGLGLVVMLATVKAVESTSWKPYSVINSFSKVFGEGVHLWLYLVALIGAWTLMTDPGLRRLLLGMSCFFVGIFLNPFLYPIFSYYLTGVTTTWRLSLAMPLPAMASLLVLVLCVSWTKDRSLPSSKVVLLTVVMLLVLSNSSFWRGFWSQPFSLAVLAMFVLVLNRSTSRFRPIVVWLTLTVMLASLAHLYFGSQAKLTTLALPRTRLHSPGLKVDQPEFAVAQTTARLAPRGYSALVPVDIGVWLPTQRQHPLLVALAKVYFVQVSGGLEPGATQRRVALLDYVSGIRRLDEAPRQLTEAVEFYKIGIVVSRGDNAWLQEIGSALGLLGFRELQQDGYFFWVRTDLPSRG